MGNDCSNASVLTVTNGKSRSSIHRENAAANANTVVGYRNHAGRGENLLGNNNARPDAAFVMFQAQNMKSNLRVAVEPRVTYWAIDTVVFSAVGRANVIIGLTIVVVVRHQLVVRRRR